MIFLRDLFSFSFMARWLSETFGAPSTRSFASFKPSPVTSRTTLMTPIFLSSGDFSKVTLNSVDFCSRCSSSASSRSSSHHHRSGSSGFYAPLIFEQVFNFAISRTLRALKSSTICSNVLLTVIPLYILTFVILNSKPTLVKSASMTASVCDRHCFE